MAYDALSDAPPVIDAQPFHARQLLPEGLFPSSRRVSFIVEPLFFRQQRLGFALFEMGPRQGIIYEALRDQISAALKGAMLVQEVVDKNRELEGAYTALKENQEKLLVSEKTAGIGRLTASIAHEMNSPVAAVRAALLELEKLIAEYRDSAGDTQVTPEDHQEIASEMGKVLRLATSAAERAADFVRSIKNQTRDTGKKERIRFDAVASVRESLLLLGHSLRKANCSVQIHSSADVIQLVGPPGRLGQVVTNLVTNAIDAMAPTGGGKIELSLEKTDEQITLCVSDRGYGVPEEIRERIWDPLFTTKPFGQGTGLGLTIVRDIIAGDFGGSVEFEPRSDGGASFRVVLPISDGGST
jgi:C4-dicarboxylate-specific signal transduction histidine kinase